MLLRGRCRFCKVRISFIYPALEIFTVLGTVAIVEYFDSWLICLAWTIFLTLGLSLSVIDQRNKRLPDALTLPLYLILLAILGVDALINGHLNSLLVAFVSSLTLPLFYLLLNIVSRGGMGFGDAKFALSVGLLTGYINAFNTVASTFIAFFLGAAVGTIAIKTGKSTRKSTLAFGPFIYLGVLLGPWLSPLLKELLGS